MTYDQHLAAAQRQAGDFFDALDPESRLVVFCHFDADGLAAGALFGRGLPRLGFTDVQVVPSGKGESAFFSSSARERLQALRPAALVVTDLGVNSAGVLDDVPTLYVDHHRPEGEPEEAAVVSGYAWEPVPSSAWLAYELLAARADVEDLAWIAAVGIMSDLGDKAPWPRLPETKKQHTAKWLKEAVVLANAARRASAFDVAVPLRLLMEADGPRAFGNAEDPDVEKLQTYRAEVNEALKEARRQAPVFSGTEPVALLRLHSACQVHPLIAQQWRGRLKDYAVIAANTGYVEGVVAFSGRTAKPNFSLPELFRRVDLGPYNDDFGHGHDQASGGHLPPQAFNRLLDALGFDAAAHVLA